MHNPPPATRRLATACLCIVLITVACADQGQDAPIAIRLVNAFEEATVEGTVVVDVPAPTIWRFDGEGTATIPDDDPSTHGWTAVRSVEGMAVIDGALHGRVGGELPIIAARRPADMAAPADDLLHAVEVRMRVTDGTELGVWFLGEDELSGEQLAARNADGNRPSWMTTLRDSDDFETYTLTSADATFQPSFSVGQAYHLALVPTDAEGAEFEIESVRLITRREHLASVESGIGWEGLSEIYRETIVARAPERITFALELPGDALLDLAIGTVEETPVTFVVSAGDSELLRRTVTTPDRWEPAPIDLANAPAGATSVTLALESEKAGAIGFWGTPTVRRTGARPAVAQSEARRALTEAAAPRGVILIIADTLRKDHLEPWGYGRDTAPTLARMTAAGTRFADNVSPGTWTKVAVPSILTSLYPSTHGLVGLPDRLPSTATTIEEVFQEAGYATFHTSSVPFTGRLSNLHQGVEVLHEAASVGDLGHSDSKTARTFVDRFLDWLDGHAEVPFFAVLHVFDPHSPYRPYAPYDTLHGSREQIAAYEADLERALEHVESEFMRLQGLPSTAELESAGIEVAPFIDFQRGWYDASIRAMDAEVARVMERLEALGIGDDTLIAFIADHGEEFQEHGRPWHGLNIYGYMINTPMMLWWPGVVPAGLVIDETVQSIDLMPTILELAGLSIPELLQGQSMVSLLAQPDNPEALGWEWRPAFAERRRIPGETLPGPDIDSFAIIAGGWKLIHNVDNLPEGWPEYELYDHATDPLNLLDVAADNPEVVQQLAARLAEVRAMAEAAKLSDEGLTEGMDPADLERLRALGYIR